MSKNKYYVYEWYVVDTGEVFYVGKGCRRRAGNVYCRNAYFKDMYYSHDCSWRIVESGMSESAAYEKEIELIKFYRENTDFRMTNVQSGGEGCDGKLFAKPVIKLSLSGEYIKEYESMLSAESETGVNNSSIAKCCKGASKYKSAGGFMWQYKSDFEAGVDKAFSIERDCGNPVIQLDLKNNILNEYPSVYAAAKSIGTYTNHIFDNCLKKTKQAHGYVWVYKRDYSSTIDYTYKNEKAPRKVEMFNSNWEHISFFESVSEASRSISGDKDSRGTIKKSCENGALVKGEYRFKYIY